MTDSSIEKLQLAAKAKKAAYELKKQFPQIVFTGGRTEPCGDKPTAMAGIRGKKSKWI